MARKPATKAEKLHMAQVAALGCIVNGCHAPATIHHCGTYMGGGRNHLNVLGLCWEHHLGQNGIDGKKMGKRVWEQKYGSERELLALTAERLK